MGQDIPPSIASCQVTPQPSFQILFAGAAHLVTAEHVAVFPCCQMHTLHHLYVDMQYADMHEDLSNAQITIFTKYGNGSNWLFFLTLEI
jgi:hypothetical protein